MGQSFLIKLLEGMEWNNQWIPLDCSKTEVEKIFGKPDIEEDSCYYFDSELRFDFVGNQLKFIEFLGGMDGTLHPMLDGVSVFKTKADQLVAFLTEKNGDNIDDSEEGYSYGFLDISVGVYRESTPEDIEEMIAEMKEDGVEIEGNEDIEEEKKKADYWATFGFGVKGYYE